MNARDAWVDATRRSVARAMYHDQVAHTALSLEHNLDIDCWGRLTRTPREIGAALRWLEARGIVAAAPDAERFPEEDGETSPLYELTEHGRREVQRLIEAAA